MAKITRESLLTLEAYARERASIRAEVMAHKSARMVQIGPQVTLHFEDELTMRYQIQEMLRAEKIFEEEGIREELAAYNPLVPDGTNWKATMMIEYPDPVLRASMLQKLLGIEKKVWVEVAGCERSWAIADEDLARATGEKTSAVHFLRFELDEKSLAAAKSGSGIRAGIAHPEYSFEIELAEKSRDSLSRDLG